MSIPLKVVAVASFYHLAVKPSAIYVAFRIILTGATTLLLVMTFSVASGGFITVDFPWMGLSVPL